MTIGDRLGAKNFLFLSNRNIINYLPPGIPDALMDVGGFNFFFFLGGGGTGESS